MPFLSYIFLLSLLQMLTTTTADDNRLLLFSLAPSITIFFLFIIQQSFFHRRITVWHRPTDMVMPHKSHLRVCSAPHWYNWVWPCSVHNNPDTGNTKAPVAATILSRTLKQHISTPSSCYHCVLTALLTCISYCCNITFHTILGYVIPVVYAKLISRKGTVYNTTKCI